jgi:hypothetical protein
VGLLLRYNVNDVVLTSRDKLRGIPIETKTPCWQALTGV